MKKNNLWLLGIAQATCLLIISYFLDRSNHWELILCWTLAWLFFARLSHQIVAKKKQLFFFTASSFMLVFSTPHLTDDHFRFVFDGYIQAHYGIAPMEFTPSQLMNLPSVNQDQWLYYLYENLNSPDYFSVYPPFLQAIFWVAAKLFGQFFWGYLLFYRLVIWGAAMYFLSLKKDEETQGKAFLFVSNPFFFIELFVNIHFEGFAFLLAILGIHYLLVNKKILLAALFLSLSFTSKLLPILVAITLFFKIKNKQKLAFFCSFALLSFVPFALSFTWEQMVHMFESLQLYFRVFEFNASLYYFFRAFFWWQWGYHPIRTLGIGLFILTFLLICYILTRTKKDIYIQLTLIFSVYFMLSPVVHPWYGAWVFGFGIWAQWPVAWAWAYFPFFSYAFYQQGNVIESFWISLWIYLPIYYLTYTSIILKKSFHNKLFFFIKNKFINRFI